MKLIYFFYNQECTACYEHATLYNGVCSCDKRYYTVSVNAPCIDRTACTYCLVCSESCELCVGPDPDGK